MKVAPIERSNEIVGNEWTIRVANCDIQNNGNPAI